MNRRVILLHGFNVRDGGQQSIGRLRPYLQAAGFDDIRIPGYGFVHLLGTAGFNDNLAPLIAGLSNPGDILIAHSNGCALGYRAIRDHGATFDHLVFINPALRPRLPFPGGPKTIQVWHSRSDLAVAAARLTSWFTLWGNMGAVGYRGPHDVRVANYDKQRRFAKSSRSHSDVFSDDLLPFFGPLIVDRLTQALQTTQP